MKERPILMSAPMVRALLAGTKTQTRRVVKMQVDLYEPNDGYPGEWSPWMHGTRLASITCPYGVPGDRLWVRETCRAHELTDQEAKDDAYGVIDRLGLEYPLYGLDGVIYKADGTFREIESTRDASERWMALNAYRGEKGAWVNSIHMPRWASRITLEITDVRVERLQEISEADCVAEGTPCYVCGRVMDGRSEDDCHCFHRKAFPSDYRMLWESINGPGSWDLSPWVWVLTFRMLP